MRTECGNFSNIYDLSSKFEDKQIQSIYNMFPFVINMNLSITETMNEKGMVEIETDYTINFFSNHSETIKKEEIDYDIYRALVTMQVSQREIFFKSLEEKVDKYIKDNLTETFNTIIREKLQGCIGTVCVSFPQTFFEILLKMKLGLITASAEYIMENAKDIEEIYRKVFIGDNNILESDK